MKNRKLIISIATLMIFLRSPLLAEEQKPLEIGAIIFSGDSLYFGSKRRTRILPRVSYQKGPLFIDGVELGAYILNNDNLKLTGSIAMDTHDIKRGQSEALSDMESLDRALDAKVGLIWKTPFAQVKANIRRDIAGAHEGFQAGLELSKPMIIGKTKVAPFTGVDWMSADTTSYYYGVNANNTNRNRGRYEANNGYILSAGIKAIHPINKHFSVMGMAKIEHYDNEITDSPIVEKKQTINVGLGLLYRF